MLKIKYAFSIAIVFMLLMSFCISVGITSAAFTAPKFLTQYIPGGFVIDEKHSGSQNGGAFHTVGIAARKVNQLPKPFKTPESSDLALGYAETTNSTYVQPMWQEAQQKAEEESRTQTNPQNTFIGKETINSGGAIYWYQGVSFNAQGAKEKRHS